MAGLMLLQMMQETELLQLLLLTQKMKRYYSPSFLYFEISKNYMHCNILLFFRLLDWQQSKVE